jgi:hypothetical protein
MERSETDLTLIIDGLLRRDDSDRIGNLARRAGRFQAQQSALHDGILSSMSLMQQTMDRTFAQLQDTIDALLETVYTQLTTLNTQAVEFAADLETLLATTPSADVTQADLDGLDTQVRDIKAAADEAVVRTNTL